MPQPTSQDGMMLLQVMSIFTSASMKEARKFWTTLPDGLGFEEMFNRYPRGSEELDHISTMMAFWDTIGCLLKRDLLNKDLVFDTFLDSPPWPKVKLFFEEGREHTNSPHEGENIQIAYELAVQWKNERDSTRS